jgi:hypothetical protein
MAQTTIQLTDEVQEQVRLAKTELGEMLAGQGNIVRRIGDALRKDPSIAENPERICVTIKQLLAVEVQGGIISEKTIENACLDEWKNSVKASAGARGAEKTSAKAREAADGEGGGAVSASAFEELQAKVARMEERFSTLKTRAEELVEAGRIEGDFIKVPKEVFTAFAEVVKG